MRLTRSRGRYLIVKLAALGDVVMASTLVGAIRARDAEAHITWLCGSGVAPLVGLFDGVDEVVEVNELALLRGSAPRLSVAVTAPFCVTAAGASARPAKVTKPAPFHQ